MTPKPRKGGKKIREWQRFLHVRTLTGKLTVIREDNDPCCIFCKEDCEIVEVIIIELRPKEED